MKLKRNLSFILLIFVIVMSGVNMWVTPGGWMDTMWTCIWCLALVTLSDKIDRHYEG
jgi:hypothetical protein